MTKSVTVVDANILPEYILPHVKVFVADPDPLVRAAYAECLPSLGNPSQ